MNNALDNHLTDSSGDKPRFKLKPGFWTYPESAAHTGINFKQKWCLMVAFTTIMVLTPLIVLMIADAKISLAGLRNHVSRDLVQLVESYAIALSDVLETNTGYEVQSSVFLKKWQNIKNHIKKDHHLDLYLLDQAGRVLAASKSVNADDPPLVSTRESLQQSGIIANFGPPPSTGLAAYTKIKGSRHVLILAQHDADNQISKLFFDPRIQLIEYLIASLCIIILSILGTTTYLVAKIQQADKKRINTLHHAESANKLAAIGRLASGVAHEINNPLAIINEKNGLLRDILSTQEKTAQQLKLINLSGDVTTAVQRCGRITRRLLDFARHLEPSIEQVSIEKIVRQILTFYVKEAERHNISIQLDFSNEIPEFKSDKGRLQQIFLNLIENAFDAMQDGGKLFISGNLNNQELTVMVSDTGTGIPEEDRHKIFEPFYTSKNEMWKTGLGLSITYGLIKEMNGDIAVKSRAGRGSQFILTLPVNTILKKRP